MATSDEHKEQYQDSRWFAKRNEILARDGLVCQSCGRTDKKMHVHHLKYLPFKDVWDYPNWMLITYCDKCHETEHLIGEVNREIFYELIDANEIYIKPIAQLSILIEKYPPFYSFLKKFLNQMIMEYQRQKEGEAIKQ